MFGVNDDCIIGVLLVDFHHARGPEIEYSYGLPENIEPQTLWPFLPFQALPDGSHSFEETFTYFTLLFDEKDGAGTPESGAASIPESKVNNYSTVFAISCSRQIKSEKLINKSSDVTRSTVQKSIVILSKSPIFGQIKDKLSIVTNAFFLQHDFSNRTIIDTLYNNLKSMYNGKSSLDESDLYVGLCLRRIVYDFKKDVLTILKAMLLEKKILIYGSDVEDLCNLQFGLISLIPDLILNLQDCGSPQLETYRRNLTMINSFKSSDRQSVLKFLGFPLQIFGEGGFFSPYTPLQQMDDLQASDAKFFVVGTSNSLILGQRDVVCDLLVNVNTKTVEILSKDKTFQQCLHQSFRDRRWMNTLVTNVTNTWNENDPFTPKNSQYEGSEDYIRLQFEEYLTGLLSSVKLDIFLQTYRENDMAMKSLPEGAKTENPINDFNSTWVSQWKRTKNFEMFVNFTDDRLFDLFATKHAYDRVEPLNNLQKRLNKSLQAFKKRDTWSSGRSVADEHPSCEVSSLVMADNDQTKLMNYDDQGAWNSWKSYFAKKKPKNHNLVKTTSLEEDQRPLVEEEIGERLSSDDSTQTSHKSNQEGVSDIDDLTQDSLANHPKTSSSDIETDSPAIINPWADS
ncbi:LAMI_0H16512g1_1 [Lachancea mirantina]|uniref:LAMI_0H16512g1_1 n=1 Tax=Lachancea mirantina TaxID=1230905 RepID=A0A1G4KJD7_9SACH|nr:LAMI_0H16512g1_1 [Lachancea mirantina]